MSNMSYQEKDVCGRKVTIMILHRNMKSLDMYSDYIIFHMHLVSKGYMVHWLSPHYRMVYSGWLR